MFNFPITNMLQSARDAAQEKRLRTGKAPIKPAVEVLIFILIFSVGGMIQGMILTPFELVAIFQSDAFTALLQNPVTDFNVLMQTVSDILVTFPDWFMPIQLFSTVGAIIACVFYCRVIEKRSWLSLGFTKKGAVGEYAAGLGIGLLLFSAAVGFCLVTGQVSLSVTKNPAVGMIILYFFGFAVQGMSEEILCRSYLMVSMQKGCPLWVAVLTNALIFTALHLGNPGVTPLALLNLTLFGIFASLYTLRRGSIWGIGAIHSIWNFAQGNLFGISVSGIAGSPSLLTATASEGGSFIHGGAFGMEGGLAVTLVLTVGCVIMMVIKTKKSEISEIPPVIQSA